MDESTKDRIVHLFDQGKPLAEIAEAVGYCESRMTQILQERGRSAWARRYPHQDEWDWDRIFADYHDGMPFEELLQKHRVSCTTFHRHRQSEQVPLRPRLGAPGEQNYQYKHGNNGKNRRRNQRCRYAARKVAVRCLGHDVPKGWHVHHMDEDPTNNEPENLALFPGKRQHALYHQQLLKLQRAGVEVDATQLVLENGGFPLPLPSHPILLPREKGRLDPRKRARKPRTTRSRSAPQKDETAPQ